MKIQNIFNLFKELIQPCININDTWILLTSNVDHFHWKQLHSKWASKENEPTGA